MVIDTNLFLLHLIGRYDLNKLDKFRATQKYNVEIFHILERFVALFKTIYTTSYVLTEVDNLSRQVEKSEWPTISSHLSAIVDDLGEERFISKVVFRHESHSVVGITDCSLIELAKRGILVVTDDLQLTIQLKQRRLGVVNLSHYLSQSGRR